MIIDIDKFDPNEIKFCPKCGKKLHTDSTALMINISTGKATTIRNRRSCPTKKRTDRARSHFQLTWDETVEFAIGE